MDSQVGRLSRCVRFFGRLAGACLLASTSLPASAATPDAAHDPADLCEQAAWQASQATGVPLNVMRAISLTETGRKKGGAFRPWPWTVNMEGKGAWFDGRAEAYDFVKKHYDRGARSFDVGCFQINYKWHGQHFTSIDQMFDPLANAYYAARFLTELHAELGGWKAAAGAYHSRTPEHAERYTKIFERHHSRLAAQEGAPPPTPAPTEPSPPRRVAQGDTDIPEIPDIVAMMNGTREPEKPRVNTYPLLQAGVVSMPGSLVPLGNGQGASLFADRGAGSLFGGSGG